MELKRGKFLQIEYSECDSVNSNILEKFFSLEPCAMQCMLALKREEVSIYGVHRRYFSVKPQKTLSTALRKRSPAAWWIFQ
jgi:hypothetical protein